MSLISYQPATMPLRVLIVDDNADSAMSVLGSIEDYGATARACFSGREALALMDSFRPEILLLDLEMPEMDGYQVARQLRLNRGMDASKIIAQTAYGDLETRKRTAGAGFDLHLTKPLSLDLLMDMLDVLRLALRR
jgi:CheY-like chemotaxis protein